MKRIIILIIVMGIALGYFLISGSKPEISRLDKVSTEESALARVAAEQVYKAFAEDGIKGVKTMMVKMDRHGYKDQEGILELMKEPRFDRAKVWSPRFDKNLLYVHVPTGGGNMIMAFLRDKDNGLKLVSVSRDVR